MSTRDDELGTEQRDALTECLDHSLCVVTAANGGERSGRLAGLASRVDTDPPRTLVCVSTSITLDVTDIEPGYPA